MRFVCLMVFACVLGGCLLKITIGDDFDLEGGADLALTSDCSGPGTQMMDGSCIATFSANEELDFSSVEDALDGRSGEVTSCSITIDTVQLFNGDTVVPTPSQVDYSLTVSLGDQEVITLSGDAVADFLSEPAELDCPEEAIEVVNAAAHGEPLSMSVTGFVGVGLDEVPDTTHIEFQGTLDVILRVEAT